MRPLKEKLIKTKKYVWDEIEGDTCSICLEEFEKGDGMARIPVCEHSFHEKCLK